jgi:JmjC domain, hydroxylase
MLRAHDVDAQRRHLNAHLPFALSDFDLRIEKTAAPLNEASVQCIESALNLNADSRVPVQALPVNIQNGARFECTLDSKKCASRRCERGKWTCCECTRQEYCRFVTWLGRCTNDERDFKCEHMRWQKFKERHARDYVYLKDWHAQREIGFTYAMPPFARDDWLNDYLLANDRDDYRFVYFGGAGSYTPLHVDVMNSCSWSHSIDGRKLWAFFEPSAERDKLVVDRFGDHVRLADVKSCEPMLFVQQPGMTVYVPPQWTHFVVNLDDALSVNHNWFDASSVDATRRYLDDQWRATLEQMSDIADADNYEQTCKQLMRDNVGMNLDDFQSLIDWHINRKCATSL